MPEGIVDVIPVDLVVSAIIAVAADGPDTDPDTGEVVPQVVQVASGSENALRYRRLVNLTSTWFKEHPLYDNDGQPIVVPEWTFPGRGRVQGQLESAKTWLERAEKVLSNLPLRGQQAQLSATVEERREEIERALGYVELYGAYAECEAVYGLDRLIALWERQTPEDQAEFNFDPRSIDWDRYVTEIHLPSVVEHGRVKSTPGARTGPTRHERLRSQVLSPDRHIAAFDLENTLIASNVVASYSWLATRRLPRDERMRFVAKTLAEAPSLLALDRKDRSRLPADVLPPLRRCARRADPRGRGRDVLRADPVEVLPRGHPPGARAPATRPPHGAHHRRARLRDRAAAAAVRRHRLRRARRERGRRATRPHLQRRAPRRASHRRDQGAGADGLRRFDRARPARVGGLRGFDERPAHARGRRLPGGGQPRDPAGGAGPQARLARRAVDEVARGSPGPGADRPAPPQERRSRQPPRLRTDLPRARRRWPLDEGAPLRTQRASLCSRRGCGPGDARRRRPSRAAPPRATSTRPSCPVRTGSASSPDWPASAAATSAPSTAPRRATSSRSCRSRSCPGTRSWPTARAPTAPTGSCSSRCSAASPATSHRCARPASVATSATASASRSASSSPACRAASAATPAAAGRR